MNLYTMATTVGAKSQFVSDNNVVAQDSISSNGVDVEILVIEFNQAAYEGFLHSYAGSAKPARSFRRIHTPLHAHVSDTHQFINARAQARKTASAS